MSGKLRITVLLDSATIPVDDPAFLDVSGEASTERHVVNALRELGHDVSILPVPEDPAVLVTGLRALAPRLVFNLTEVFRDSRRHDKNIAALLEMLGLPFTGTGSTGLMLCRDKGLCKQLLSLHKIRVPGFLVFPCDRRLRVPKHARFPMVVKPAFADGSEGIANASFVKDPETLVERVDFVHRKWRQSAIAEEYIDGRELYVGVVGDQRLTVLPPRELFFTRAEEGGPLLATYRVKWDHAYQEKWGISFGFAELSGPTWKNVERVCRKAFRILELRDYGRVDLKITGDGRIVILEVNPNPDIAYGEEVAEAAEKAGITYTELIRRIVAGAMRRHARGEGG
jgi:D-alanine-D-alanine ligase